MIFSYDDTDEFEILKNDIKHLILGKTYRLFGKEFRFETAEPSENHTTANEDNILRRGAYSANIEFEISKGKCEVSL